jgi:DNA replication protein DnaC
MRHELEEILQKISVTDEVPESPRIPHQHAALYAAANVPDRHRRFRPAHSTEAAWNAQYDAIKGEVGSGPMYGILGTRGCGKTEMACCTIGYVTNSLGKSAYYSKAVEIFRDMHLSMRGESPNERDVILKYRNPYLLVIDAFEARSESDFENRTLDYILDCRYDDVKSTIIVSNQKKTDFLRIVGPSTCDRIVETGGIIECDWPSFRGKGVRHGE